MKVNVAGAGAGKTTMMAELISEYDIPDGKIVFCIAFTKAAADNIIKKIEEKYGAIPSNIKISTIHSFLNQELIQPFYYFLFAKQFEQISIIDLPVDYKNKNAIITRLEEDNILHRTAIPERAKWIVYQKSGEGKKEKCIRQNLLNQFKGYCAAIFVDEAQDIGKDEKIILESLEKAGIEILLYGDPKQDVRGHNYFKEIVEKSLGVKYIPDCHRCPQKHLEISNTLASEKEKQVADEDHVEGSIEVVYESDVDNVKTFLENGKYGLAYISKRNQRFETHEKNKTGERFETLRYEVHKAMVKKWSESESEIEIKRAAFHVTEKMLMSFDKGRDISAIIFEWVKEGAFNWLPERQYAQMAAAFRTQKRMTFDIPVVQSIEAVKGLEAERCLFIFTTDLAPYLFREKRDNNRTSNLLYVALTRSLDHLSILITKEVETKYTRAKINNYFQEYL